MPRSFRVAFLILALPCQFARADEFPVARGPSREPQPYRYDRKLLDTLPKAFFEETSVVVLYAGTSHVIEPDGTQETITHEITRFNGRKGIDSYGEFRSIYYDPSFQKLTLNEARVLKKDGRTIPVEPRHLHLRDVATDFQVYDSDKQLVISFPGLEVGDAYEVKWSVRGKNPEFDGQFFTRYTFGDDTAPIVLDELHVSLPRDAPFHFACVNGKLEPARRDDKDRKHYRWQVRERWPLPQEEDRPSRELRKLQVACSTFQDWKAVAAWKEKVRKDCWECGAEVRRLVRDLTKDLAKPQDKARALTYWVRQNIRYLSRGPAGTGYTPHRPDQVLAHLFGDCKDQAQLLAVMLRAIDLDPYLVTLGILDDGQVIEAVPCPWGTHGILMVPIEGKQHWIDTTISMAPWDWLPRSDRDRQAYLTRRGDILLQRTPPYTLNDNRIEQTTFVAVQGDGTSICLRSMFYHGGVALGRRESWVEATPGERRRYLTSELQDAHPRCKLESIDIPERTLIDWDKAVQARVRFVIPTHFSGKAAMEASVSDSPVWGRIIAYNPDSGRSQPLNLGSPFESIHLYVIQLPPAYRFDGLPRDREVTSEWGTYRLLVKPDEKDPRRLELVMHTRLKRTSIDPKEFADFQKFTDELSQAYRVWLSARPTSEIEDAPLLETLLAFAPGSDALAARTLARLYLDHDRPDDARRVLDGTCVYHPDDVELWALRIKAAKDAPDKERLHAALVRYFPDEPSYALTLGAARRERADFAGAHAILAPLARHASMETRAKAYHELAHLCMRQNLPGPALMNFEAAWQVDPSVVATSSSMRFLAQVHEKRGDRAEALKAVTLAHKLEAGNVDILSDLIRLEVAAGKQLDALDHMRRLVLAVNDDVSGLIHAAELYYQMERWDEAHELALRARDAGFQGRVQKLLGLLHLRKGNLEKAIFHLERGDQGAAALEALIQAHLAQGQLPQAHRLLEQVSRLSPATDSLRSWEADVRDLTWRHKALMILRPDPSRPASAERIRAASFYLCADLAYRKGHPRERVKHLLTRAMEETQEIAPAHSLRALLLLEEGLLRNAAHDVATALRLSAEDTRGLYVRGRIRLEKAEPGALDDLTRAVAQSRESDPAILHWLATALHQSGRLDEALTAQRKALALRPGDTVLAAQLGMLENAKR